MPWRVEEVAVRGLALRAITTKDTKVHEGESDQAAVSFYLVLFWPARLLAVSILL
jgi:hypothetical protein